MGICGQGASEGEPDPAVVPCVPAMHGTHVEMEPRTNMAALTLAVAEKLARKKGRARTIHGLLRDPAMFVGERSDDGDMQRMAEENCVTVLQAMLDEEMEPWDVSLTGDISPTVDQDGNPERGTLTVQTKSKGLGLAGKVQAPCEMWVRRKPCNWAESDKGTTERRANRHIKLAAMIQRVQTDGVLDRVQGSGGPKVKPSSNTSRPPKGR